MSMDRSNRGLADNTDNGSEYSPVLYKLELHTKSRDEKVNYLPCLFAVLLIFPNYFFVGSVRLSPYLIYLLVLFVPLIFIWVSGRAGQIKKADWFFLFFCLWGGVALAKTHGVSTAVEPFGILVLQTYGSYLLGRCLVRNKATFLAVFKIHILIVMFLLPFAYLETTTSEPVYLNLFSFIGATHANVWMEPRMGLDRVQAAFEHPILYGVFVASAFSIHFQQTKGLKRFFLSLVLFIATVISVSTGAILCLVSQCGILLWGKIFQKSRKRWRNLIILFLTFYITVDLASDRTPFNVFVDYLTFNSGSAYNRILIWKYGTAEVWRHPFFGIGMNDWERPHFMSASMDNFWLINAVRYGLPGFALLVIGMISILIGAGKRTDLEHALIPLRQAAIISIIGIMIAICSVHLWNSTYCWFMFLFGSIVWFMDQGKEKNEKLEE